MSRMIRMARMSAVVLTVGTSAACSGASQIGDILGGVLGGAGGTGGQAQATVVAGTIRGVNTQSQQIALQQSNGSTVALGFDNNTRVVYQNQNYPVTSLENGDQVRARVQTNGSAYYTDSLQVTASVSSSSGTSGGTNGTSVQSLQGNVRQVDVQNGVFTVDAGSGVQLVVSLPYNASSTDVNKFRSLRNGDYVRFYGVYLNNSRVELRQFY